MADAAVLALAAALRGLPAVPTPQHETEADARADGACSLHAPQPAPVPGASAAHHAAAAARAGAYAEEVLAVERDEHVRVKQGNTAHAALARARADAMAAAWDMRMHALLALEEEQAAMAEDALRRGVQTAEAALDRVRSEKMWARRAATAARDAASDVARVAKLHVRAAHALDTFLLSLQRDLSPGIVFDSGGNAQPSPNPVVKFAAVESSALRRAAAALVAASPGGSRWRVRATLRVVGAATEDELLALASAHAPRATPRAASASSRRAAGVPSGWRCAVLPLAPEGCKEMLDLLRDGVPPSRDAKDAEAHDDDIDDACADPKLLRVFPKGTPASPSGEDALVTLSARCVSWLRPRIAAADSRIFFCVEARVLCGDDTGAPAQIADRVRNDANVRMALEAVVTGAASLRACARVILQNSSRKTELIECSVWTDDDDAANERYACVRLHLAPATTARLLEHPVAATLHGLSAAKPIIEAATGATKLLAGGVPHFYLLSSNLDGEAAASTEAAPVAENSTARSSSRLDDERQRWPVAHAHAEELPAIAVRELLACYAFRSADAPTAMDVWPASAQGNAALAICWDSASGARKHNPRVALVLSLTPSMDSSGDEAMCAFAGCGVAACTSAPLADGRAAQMCSLHRSVADDAVVRANVSSTVRKPVGGTARMPSGTAVRGRAPVSSAASKDVWSESRIEQWLPRAVESEDIAIRAGVDDADACAPVARLADVRRAVCRSSTAASLLGHGDSTPPLLHAVDAVRGLLEAQIKHAAAPARAGSCAGATRLRLAAERVARLARSEARLSDRVAHERAVLGGLQDAVANAGTSKDRLPRSADGDVALSRAVLAALARFGETGSVRPARPSSPSSSEGSL